MVGNEGLVGLSAILDAPHPSYLTQATIGGNAVRVRPAVIKDEFVRGHAIQQLVLKHISAHIVQLSQKALCNGRHKLDERLCTWLLMVHDRTAHEELQLTHEEVAHHLGARRAGVTAVCNDLRDRGIIKYRRGLMSLLHRQLLESAACECYRTLRGILEQSQV